MNASQPMSGRIAVVTGATGGIGKATAAGLAGPRRSGRHRRAESRPARRSRRRTRRPVGRRRDRRVRGRPLVAGAGAPTRRRTAGALPAHRRAGQQRRRILGAPPRHGGRARADIRAEPPRAVPADGPPRRPDAGAGMRRSSPSRRARRRSARSTSTTSRGARTTPASGRTTSPSSPTCCSRSSWLAAYAGPRHRERGAPGCHPHGLRRRGPGAVLRVDGRHRAPLHALARTRRGHGRLGGLVARARRRLGRVLPRSPREAALPAVARRVDGEAALAGQRGAGRPHVVNAFRRRRMPRASSAPPTRPRHPATGSRPLAVEAGHVRAFGAMLTSTSPSSRRIDASRMIGDR